MTAQFVFFWYIFGKMVSSNLGISIFLPIFVTTLAMDAFSIPLWLEMGSPSSEVLPLVRLSLFLVTTTAASPFVHEFFC